MDYKEAEKYLSFLLDREKISEAEYPDSLEPYRNFLKKVGEPHKDMRGFLIGGTKGKGSTAYIIEKIFRSYGYRTGLYTSPHIENYRERIRINGNPISEREFAGAIEQISSEGTDISVFETLTTIAFMQFKKTAVEVPIFEVGLGGRLDATNVIEPDVSIITKISYDHTDILGESLKEIAGEKVRIFRSGGINLSAPQEEEVESLFIEETDGNVEFIKNYELVDMSDEGTRFTMHGALFKTGLIGTFQAENSALAINASRRMDVPLQAEDFNEFFQDFVIPGRFQILRSKPTIVLDGAHNPESMKALGETLRRVFPGKVSLLFSCLSDKNVKKMLGEILPRVEKIYPTSLKNPRAITKEEVKSVCEELGSVPEETEGIPPVDLRIILKEADPEDVILVTGSFYLLREIWPFLREEGYLNS